MALGHADTRPRLPGDESLLTLVAARVFSTDYCMLSLAYPRTPKTAAINPIAAKNITTPAQTTQEYPNTRQCK
jgi:hypothetical protein